MSRWCTVALASLVASSFVAGGCGKARDEPRSQRRVEASPAPAASAGVESAQAAPRLLVGELQAVDLDGLRAMIAKGGAKLTLVTAWATWCVPCIEEMPTVAAFWREHAADGLRVIALSMDDRAEMPDQIQAVLDRVRVPFEMVIVEPDAGEDLMKALEPTWAGALPATFVFDATGRKILFLSDALTRQTLDQRVTPLLGK